MKRIINLILVLSICLGMLAVIPGNAKEKTESNSAEMLYTLGCINEELRDKLLADETVTRAEFAQILYETAKLDSLEEVNFNDVMKNSPYAKAISAVNQYNIMKGDGSNCFNPDKNVSEIDALVSVLRLLGYEEYAYYNGGYPTGYKIAARTTKLLSGIPEITSDDITGNTLSVLIKNMFNERIYEVTSVEDGNSKKNLTERTFLSLYYNIERISGVVTGNTATLLSENKTPGGIKIGDKFMSVETTNYDIYIGYNCDAYYNRTTNKLLYIEKNNKNSVEVINGSSIIRVIGKSIIYELYEGKEKTVTFPTNAYILYNGRALKNYSEEIFDIATGEVNLIDNNGDGKTDVVSILSYETYIIDSVNSVDEVIIFKYGGGTITENDLKEVDIFSKTGKLDLSWLHEWDALDVLKDDSGKIVAIYAAGKIERKAATEIVLDANEGYVVFDDGTSAPIQKNATERLRGIELNVKNVFSFDMFGNIVAYTKDEIDKVCVLIASGETGSFEPNLIIKYYTEAGDIIQRELEGIIKFNNERRDLTKTADYNIVKAALEAAEGDLIEINTASNGKIELINIMEIVYNSNGAAVSTYLNAYANAVCPSSTQTYFVKKTANAFYVPNNLSGATEIDFAVKKATAVGARTVAVVVYKKLGSTDIDADAVKFVKTSGMDSMGSYDNPMLVSKKTKVYVESEDAVYTKLSYWWNGGEQTAIVKEASVIAHIDEGDVAWIDVDEGEIIGAVKYFDYSENTHFPPETTTPKAFTSSRKMNKGYVLKTYDECYEFAIPIRLASKDADGNNVYTDSEKIELHRYPTYGYVFDSSKNIKVRKATAADFIGFAADPANYSRAFVHSSYTTDYMAVIYK